jgi:hypothetical protein
MLAVGLRVWLVAASVGRWALVADDVDALCKYFLYPKISDSFCLNTNV